MTLGAVGLQRALVGALVLSLASSVAGPSAPARAALDPELVATLELRDGFVDYEIAPGPVYVLDDDGQPLAVQIIDGCAVNDHYWLFGAGLSGVPLTLSVMDLDTGKEKRVVLPPFEPGVPVGTVFDVQALPICGDDTQVGGLPPLDATATFSAADERGQDLISRVRLLSDGSDRAYQRIAAGGETYRIISRRAPVAAIDESSDLDRLYLLTEGRIPRTIEGLVFSGDEGMLPDIAELTATVADLPRSRVRRAYELVSNGREPKALVGDLGLRRVQRLHHVDLDFETLGAAAYLAMAGWIREGGKPIAPPALVEERFVVELVQADGTRSRVPLTGPFVGSDAAGARWEYGSPDARVQISDSCRLTGSFWTWAGARTDEPLELAITDTVSGEAETLLLWTDQREVSTLADTAALTGCP